MTKDEELTLLYNSAYYLEDILVKLNVIGWDIIYDDPLNDEPVILRFLRKFRRL